MSSADETKTILLLEQFADEARRLAAARRAQLEAKARKQLEEDGIAPSWALPEVAKVTLSTTRTAPYIADAAKFTAWVADRHPDQMEQIVRSAFEKQLLAALVVDGDRPVYLETGEIVPGVAVRKGGQPKHLSITADPGVKHELAAAVAQMLATAHPAIAGPVEDSPQAPNDPWIPSGDPFAAFPAAGAA